MEIYRKKIDDYIKQLSPKTIMNLTALIKLKKYKKGEVLLEEGQICKNMILIAKGVARKYLIHNGKEITWKNRSMLLHMA